MTNSLDILKQEQPTLNAITLFNYGNDRDVSSIVLNEISFLEGMAVTKPDILNCEKQSIIMATKYVLKNNLSFDPNSGLVYVKTRSIPLKKDGNNKVTEWGKVLEVQATCEGLLSIAYQCGKILDHERPKVTKDEKGKVIEVVFKYLKPSIPSPRWVEIAFDESDFKRWMTASHKENSRGKDDASTKNYCNPNYFSFNGGIDPEFARAKAIRHAMKKMGTNPNERLAVNIKPAIQNTIETEVDIATAGEETAATEYTDFQEVKSETKAPAPPIQEEIPSL